MTETLLRCRQLYAGYGKQAVVRALDLEARAGEVLALLGPNGAGKTTTLTTIAGLQAPIGGAVEILGEPLSARAPHRVARRGLSFVPDDRALFGALTVRENMRVASRSAGALDLALEYFPALEPRLDVRAGALSGGEQQMLAIARGLVSQPRILMIDELSMGLAPAVAARVLQAVRRIATDIGAAVILVEQHVRQALEIADRAVVLVHGDVRMAESAAALRADPELLEQAYLGSTAEQTDPLGAIS
ncbi:ABC transporter ATP-binding protein [Nocardia sp. NPDC052278]|uniref:ABC transporter ATP-binding protein n=1 Tax=unclassified Nocardia TaxID=2637762 RepID=UPI00367577D8